MREHELSPEDEDLLAELLDQCVDELLEGRELDLANVLSDRPDLDGPVRETVELARTLARQRKSEPMRIEGYQILRELGHGGMGTVYLAWQQSLSRKVALKVLPHASAMSERARRRFLEEARAMARVRDDHIVAIHDVVVADGVHAYAMEWIDGLSLAQVIDRLRRRAAGGDVPTPGDLAAILDVKTRDLAGGSYVQFVVGLGRDIARALEKVHAAGLVHRDVKPSNVMIRRDGRALLADFGLVRSSQSSVTRTAGFVGTPVYSSPEQLQAGDAAAELVDARADVYSLAVTLFEAVTLVPPFTGRTAGEVLQRIEQGDAGSLCRLAPHAPRDLETILQHAMEPNRERRYETARAFADDLDRLLHLKPIAARPPSIWRRGERALRRHRVAAASLVTAAVVAVVLGLLWLRASDAAAAPTRAAACVQRARTLLVDLSEPQLVWIAIHNGAVDDSVRNYEETLTGAVNWYDSALELQPSSGWQRERTVVAFARHCLRRRPVVTLPDETSSMGVAAALVDSLPPLTGQAARQMLRSLSVPALAVDEIAAASTVDRRALGLLAYLWGDGRLGVRAWEGLERGGDAANLEDYGLGSWLLANERPERAYPYLLRAAEGFPDQPHVRACLADAAVQVGELEVAARALAQTRDPNDRAWRRLSADLAMAQGQLGTARRGYELLHEQSPSHHVSLRLAQLDRMTGRIEDAMTRLRGMLGHGMRPRDVLARRMMAECALQAADLPTYLAQARYAVLYATSYDLTRRSPGVARELLEILRLGGLQELYGEVADEAGLHRLRATAAFPDASWAEGAPFFGRTQAERVLRQVGAFDADGFRRIYTLPSGPEAEIASAVCRAIVHFPEVTSLIRTDAGMPLFVTASAARRFWSSVVDYVLPRLCRPLPSTLDALAFRIVADRSARELGSAVGAAGDVDLDGHPDILASTGAAVGGPRGRVEREVRVVSGRSGEVLHVFRAAPGQLRFGAAVAGGGDVDGDGRDDLIVGVPGAGDDYHGAAVVYSGANGCIIRTLRGVTPRGALGAAVCNAGDLDQDRHADIAVGGGGPDCARLRVFSGREGRELAALDWPGTAVAVASGGDFDGDGVSELIVGVTGRGSDPGRVLVLSGRWLAERNGLDVLWSRAGGVAADEFGGTVSGPGDLDGDGCPDVLVGTNESVAALSGRSGDPLWVFEHELARPRRAFQCAGAADLDGDGRPEVVIATSRAAPDGAHSGRAWVLSGCAGEVLLEMSGGLAFVDFGRALVSCGDTDRDGCPDLAISAPGSGPGLSRPGAVYVLSGRAMRDAVAR